LAGRATFGAGGWGGAFRHNPSVDRRSRGFTFDDLILLPGHIDFGVDAIDLNSRLTARIPLRVPFASSPMDTVTGGAMAIAMALQGGIGVIHGRCPIEKQVRSGLRRGVALARSIVAGDRCRATAVASVRRARARERRSARSP
jgi:IMP dehydrogenase/GMP reductase